MQPVGGGEEQLAFVLAPNLAQRFEPVLRLLEIRLRSPHGFPRSGLRVTRHATAPVRPER